MHAKTDPIRKPLSVTTAAGLLLALAGSVLTGGVPAARAQNLTGAGATFPNPIYTKWFAAYGKANPNVTINYQAIGSGGGQKQISEGTVDFGASDGPMSDASLAKAKGKILHLPTVAGAVVLAYNLPGRPKVKLDSETIANIFLGKIKRWTDPAIAKLNPGYSFPDWDIAVAHRADGSGTTYIFTDYLSKVSPEFAKKVGKNTSVSWPTGTGAKGNDGVTGLVRQVPGSLGYVELIYAVQNRLFYADVQNAAGNFVTPSLDSITAALSTANIPDDFRFSMVNAPGATSYPISGVTWLLVYEEQKDPAKGKALVGFLKWYLNEGETMARALDYAPLPNALRARVRQRIEQIKA